jgi:hypothetical protein
MKIKNILLGLLFLSFISCQSQNVKKSKTDTNIINCNGIYVSRDTLYSLDKQYKNEITLRLLKFNKNFTVQTSIEYTYLEGEEKLNNLNVTDWLDIESKYNYVIKNKKLVIQCYSKQPKRAWNDFATGGDITIKETFKMAGNIIYKIKPFFNHQNSRKKFSKLYILDETLTNNHKKVRKGNGCAQN